MKCGICKRELNDTLDPEEGDPFAVNCGGDCIWCMIGIEYEIDDFDTAIFLLEEVTRRIKIKKALEL